MGGTSFGEMITSLENMGFYDVLLPFILVFTIIFAVLEKVKLFGASSKNINIIVAVSIAFFVVRVSTIVIAINSFLPKVSFIVLALMMFLLVLGIFGTSSEGWSGWPFIIAVLGSIVGIIWALVTSLPAISLSLPTWLRLDSGDKAILFAVGIFVILLMVFKEKNSNSHSFGNWIKQEIVPDKFGRPPRSGKP